MMKICVLGSTGSIGMQTLDVVRNHPDKFKVVALTANKSVGVLNEQIKEFKPSIVAIGSKKELVNHDNVRVGSKGLVEVVKRKYDVVVNGLVGSCGILPSYHALKAGNNVALANKESLVAAGEQITRVAESNDAEIIPVDSEHSAIFQCLHGRDVSQVKRIILTCSGGPFRSFTAEQLMSVTKEQALEHPTWKMGGKISVDSATLMNKGFELLETHWLYNLSLEKIDIVIHPESIVHSLVEYTDHSVIAQMSWPDMRMPIQLALTWPKRYNGLSKQLNLWDAKQLSFEKWDSQRFSAPALAKEAGLLGDTFPAVLNAANEAAVNLFIDGKIPFNAIVELSRRAVKEHKPIENASVDEIVALDGKVKQEIREWASGL